MSLLCKIFGHVPAYGYGDRPGRGYFNVELPPYEDNIGRLHCDLTCKCERCGIKYNVGKIHLPKDEYYEGELYKKQNTIDFQNDIIESLKAIA